METEGKTKDGREEKKIIAVSMTVLIMIIVIKEREGEQLTSVLRKWQSFIGTPENPRNLP